MDIRRSVHQTVAESLGVAVDRLDPHAERRNVPGWDSLAMVKIVLALEERFAIELTGDEVTRMTSVTRIADIMSARGARETEP